jgi:hypothetical protein
MGYRELLKKYIRFLELYQGDNFIETIPEAKEQIFTKRDLGELRTVAAEVFREHQGTEGVPTRVRNNNYRFRLLLNRYGLSVEQAARLVEAAEEKVRRWRTHPRSRRYLEMSDQEFVAFEERLDAWLEVGEGSMEDAPASGDGDGPDEERG